MDPKFILLDEPFAGVDPIAVEDIQTVVARLTLHRVTREAEATKPEVQGACGCAALGVDGLALLAIGVLLRRRRR